MTLSLFVEATLYTCCLGDLKALVGTADLPNESFTQPRQQPLPYQDYVDHSRASRSVHLDYSVYALKVSIDKRPEDISEVVRIVRASGRVHRHPDSRNLAPGPQKIWRGENSFPGLTVSRAIGDKENADLGVISEPEFTQYRLRLESDNFIVIGSSGLWEIMEDSEVVRFVEKYRDACVRSGLSPPSGVQRSAAQLLCEEARMRWLPVMEKEGTKLEDISAVVVELQDDDNSSLGS